MYFKDDPKNKKAFLSIENLASHTNAALRRGLNRVGHQLRKSAQAGIKNPPKTGRKYKGLRNRSSASGQYPANQSGDLRNSIGFKTLSPRKLKFGSRIKYAQYLEGGMKRLLIQFTVQKNHNNIYNTLRNSLEAELK